MDKKEIDYIGMAQYFNMSERTLRRWENEKAMKFEIMLDEFIDQQKTELPSSNAKIVVVVSQKGGVGKTTISDSLGFYLGDAVILNLDLSQPSKGINACNTIDYVDYYSDDSNVGLMDDILEKAGKQYRYIIIDTPGEVTPEVGEAVLKSNKFIIPMTIGKRAREKTRMTLETFFGKGSSLKGNFKIHFVFNAYKNDKKRDIALEHFQEMFEDFTPSKDITIEAAIGTLDHSDAMSTAEEEGKSIFSLASENKGAYRSILGKIQDLCTQMENHLELQ